MPILSPVKHKLSLIKEALFGDRDIIYEVLLCNNNKLPKQGVQVDWFRDGKFIVGKIKIGEDEFMTQAKTAQEFVEMVNDAIYAIYDIPLKYAQKLGGNYRLVPTQQEFKKLNDAAVKKSSFNPAKIEAIA